jgi:hypothetical protein
VLLANGKIGARVPRVVVAAQVIVLAQLSLKPTRRAEPVPPPGRVRNAILNIALSTARWATGVTGARAPRPVVVVPDLAIAESTLLLPMAAELVLLPMTPKIAILSIVQLTAI